jgi:hypothetical protein
VELFLVQWEKSRVPGSRTHTTWRRDRSMHRCTNARSFSRTGPFRVAVFCLLGAPWLPAADPCEITIVPPHSTVYGKSMGDWGAEWWRWVLSVPWSKNPCNDPTGERWYEGQSPVDLSGNPCRDPQGPVLFLAGSAELTTERTITIPGGKSLFIQMVDAATLPPADCQECSECMQGAMEADRMVSSLELIIDDTSVPDLDQYEEVASDCVCAQIPADNPFGLAEGILTPVPAAGFSAMLEPLCPGEHTIHWTTCYGAELCFESTYHITVRGEQLFRRGDTNEDAKVNIADAIYTLDFLFGHGATPSCEHTADANDDGKIDIADAVAVLGYLFAQAGPLPDPFAACGSDQDGHDLACDSFAPCAR